MKKFFKSMFALLFIFFILNSLSFVSAKTTNQKLADIAKHEANKYKNYSGRLYNYGGSRGIQSVGAGYWNVIMKANRNQLGYSDNWCARHIGKTIPVKVNNKVGADSRCGAGDLADYFRAKNKWKSGSAIPAVGDIFFFNPNSKLTKGSYKNIYNSKLNHYVSSHTGIVVKVDKKKGIVQTVEGNVGNSNAGYSTVAYRTYKISYLRSGKVLGYRQL